MFNSQYLHTQNELLLQNLLEFYKDPTHMNSLTSIITERRETTSPELSPISAFETNPLVPGLQPPDTTKQTRISLRILDWFVTNYAKKYFVVYELQHQGRFKVYHDYKLKLKAYGKQRFDPFRRWERIVITKGGTDLLRKSGAPERKDSMFTHTNHDDVCQKNEAPESHVPESFDTTIGQLNFFKWAIENKILDYIEHNFAAIEQDMMQRNSTSKKRAISEPGHDATKTRKKREELSESATKCIKKESVKIVVKFHL